MIRFAGEVLAVIGALAFGIVIGRGDGPRVEDGWCCYDAFLDPSRVIFNPGNKVVQCHGCGAVWLPVAA